MNLIHQTTWLLTLSFFPSIKAKAEDSSHFHHQLQAWKGGWNEHDIDLSSSLKTLDINMQERGNWNERESCLDWRFKSSHSSSSYHCKSMHGYLCIYKSCPLFYFQVLNVGQNVKNAYFFFNVDVIMAGSEFYTLDFSTAYLYV